MQGGVPCELSQGLCNYCDECWNCELDRDYRRVEFIEHLKQAAWHEKDVIDKAMIRRRLLASAEFLGSVLDTSDARAVAGAYNVFVVCVELNRCRRSVSYRKIFGAEDRGTPCPLREVLLLKRKTMNNARNGMELVRYIRAGKSLPSAPEASQCTEPNFARSGKLPTYQVTRTRRRRNN